MKCIRFTWTLFLAPLIVQARSDGPLTPEQSLQAFHHEPGVRVEIAAAEPLTASPATVVWDEYGRMFVAEERGYPVGPGEGKPPAGIVAMLEDTDGDGRYDRRTLFADNLTFPNGLLPWKGGLYVTCAPDVYYLKDTNGDGRADVRQVVLTGFSTKSTTQLRVSHPTLGLDNWIHLTAGLVGGTVTAPDHPERKPVEFVKSDSRFRPDTHEFETTAGQSQFGLTFDDFGHRFTVANRNPLWHIVLLPHYLKRNPYLAFSETVQEVSASGEAAKVFPRSKDTTTASYMPSLMGTPHAGTFTSACGITLYRGDALPAAMYGSAFICENAQNLVQRQVLTPRGATFASKYATEDADFLASTDSWFRPVFASFGPDGALYICDMYRKTIDHPQYLPESIRSTTDFESGKGMGRIYRLVADKPAPARGTKKRRPDALARAHTQELCAALGDPNGWVRDTARRLLLERRDPAAVPLLKALIEKQNARASTGGFARVAALSLLEGVGALDETTLRLGLHDPSAGVREFAVQLAEPRLAQSKALADELLSLADDSDAKVRFRCALALGEIDDSRTIPALAKIGIRDSADRWARAAVLSSIGRRSGEFLQAVLAQAKEGTTSPELMESLGQVLAASQPLDRLVSLFNELTVSTRERDFRWQLATLSGMADSLRNRRIKGSHTSALQNLLATDSPATLQARQRLGALIDRAVAVAANPKQDEASRLAAIELLAHADYAQAGQLLVKLLGPLEPSALQSAAVQSLSRMSDPVAGKLLVERERWRAYSPGVREVVLAALLSQPRLIIPLLDAVEAGVVQPWALTPRRRTQLENNRDKTISQRAKTLFKDAGGGDRMKVYEEYKAVLGLKPNAKNGRDVFIKTCATCHVAGSVGTKVGPDLTGVRNQPKEALLLHLIVPDAEILPGYTSYEVETKDGRTLTGLLASETPTSVTLRAAQGVEENILRRNIATMSSTSLSLMPQELEKTMSKQDLADLIGFLKGE